MLLQIYLDLYISFVRYSMVFQWFSGFICSMIILGRDQKPTFLGKQMGNEKKYFKYYIPYLFVTGSLTGFQ